MNERIKQLAEQAGMTDDKFGMYFAKDKHDEDGVDLEKFAELFVAECVKVAHPKLTDVGEWAAGMRLVQKRLKQHFGVEE